MRLTEKYDDNSGYGVKEEDYAYEQHFYIDLGAYENCVQKLGQLEDIEEELGIDLITLFKALNNGVYDLLGNHWNVRLNKEEGKWYLYTMLIKYSHTQVEEIYKDRLSFSTYGKTWALTKEELI